MQIETMRQAIKNRYKGVAWDRKVDRMSDNQVMAIYMRLVEKNELSTHNYNDGHQTKIDISKYK